MLFPAIVLRSVSFFPLAEYAALVFDSHTVMVLLNTVAPLTVFNGVGVGWTAVPVAS